MHRRRERLLEAARQQDLVEAMPKRSRRRRPGSASRKTSLKCPQGMHMQGGRCSRISPSELSRRRRKQKKWAKSAAGKKSAKRQARYKKRWS